MEDHHSPAHGMTANDSPAPDRIAAPATGRKDLPRHLPRRTSRIYLGAGTTTHFPARTDHGR
jgi:hypothetical protein